MKRLLIAVVAAVVLFAPAWASLAHAQPKDDAALRERVLAAIDRAQGFLISQQLGDGSWQPSLGRWKIGVSSMAVLALLNSGLPTDHPRVARGLEFLRNTDLPNETYELATMILALAAMANGIFGRAAVNRV